MVGQFLKRMIPAQQKLAKKQMVLGELQRKNQQVLSFIQVVSLVLKISCTSFCPPKQITHNLNVRKKMNAPENCITPSPCSPPPKKIKV